MLSTIGAGLGTMCFPVALLSDGDLLHPEQQGPEHSSGIPEHVQNGHYPRPYSVVNRGRYMGHHQR